MQRGNQRENERSSHLFLHNLISAVVAVVPTARINVDPWTIIATDQSRFYDAVAL